MLNKIIFPLFFVFFLISCKKETVNTPVVVAPIPSTAVLKFSGSFMGANGYSVAGSAKIFQEGTVFTLSLENFTSSSGPDLKVYLSKQQTPTEFISLGNLKATSGNQNYVINGSPNFADFKFIIVHCQQFNRVFGSSELK